MAEQQFTWIEVHRNEELRLLDVVELRGCPTCGRNERFVLLADTGINVARCGACYTWRVHPVRCCRADEIVQTNVCLTFKVAIERHRLFRRAPVAEKNGAQSEKEVRDARHS